LQLSPLYLVVEIIASSLDYHYRYRYCCFFFVLRDLSQHRKLSLIEKMTENTFDIDNGKKSQNQHIPNGRNVIKIINTQLDLEQIVNEVRANEAGAIATFMGTTRDHFNNKRVIKLEYEAYIPMAEKEMLKICDIIREYCVHFLSFNVSV
jgi:hypothetical protein